MAYATDDPAERERRRWIKPNAYLWVRPDIHRFMRPDAERFFHPSHKGQKPWYEQPEYMSPAMRVYAETPASPYGPDDPTARADASAAEADRRAFEAELEQLRADHAELQRQILAQRQALALSRLTRKAGFDPNQPRVPAGNPDGGQWTDAVGAGERRAEGAADPSVGGINDLRATSDAQPDNEWIPGARYAQFEMGILLGQAIIHPSRGGGRDCFYRFSYGIVAVTQSATFACPPTIPWFAATHGRFIR